MKHSELTDGLQRFLTPKPYDPTLLNYDEILHSVIKACRHLRDLILPLTICDDMETRIIEQLRTTPNDTAEFNPRVVSSWDEYGGRYTFFTQSHVYQFWIPSHQAQNEGGAFKVLGCLPWKELTLSYDASRPRWFYLSGPNCVHALRYHSKKLNQAKTLIEKASAKVDSDDQEDCDILCSESADYDKKCHKNKSEYSFNYKELVTHMNETFESQGWTWEQLADASFNSVYMCKMILGGNTSVKLNAVLAVAHALQLVKHN